MIELYGDFWDLFNKHSPGAICCTTNRVLNSSGELIMGAGIAKQFKQKFPELPKIWGKRIRDKEHVEGFMVESIVPGGPTIFPIKTKFLVAFPTKYDWKEKSSLNLIEKSLQSLTLATTMLNWSKVFLPRPGCSNGGLHWEKEVKPICEQYLIDDRFIIIERD